MSFQYVALWKLDVYSLARGLPLVSYEVDGNLKGLFRTISYGPDLYLNKIR